MLIERVGTRVCGMIFQDSELRALLAAPILNCSQQLPTNAMILMLASYRNLRNKAVDHLPVHSIRWPIQPGIYESNNVTTELCDERNAFCALVLRMLSSLSVTCRYGFNRRHKIQLRIKTGMMLSALNERAGNSAGILCHSATNNGRRL
jgi:hypothetical protein